MSFPSSTHLDILRILNERIVQGLPMVGAMHAERLAKVDDKGNFYGLLNGELYRLLRPRPRGEIDTALRELEARGLILRRWTSGFYSEPSGRPIETHDYLITRDGLTVLDAAGLVEKKPLAGGTRGPKPNSREPDAEIAEQWENYKRKLPKGKRPKLAVFAESIDTPVEEVKAALERHRQYCRSLAVK